MLFRVVNLAVSFTPRIAINSRLLATRADTFREHYALILILIEMGSVFVFQCCRSEFHLVRVRFLVERFLSFFPQLCD